MKENCLNAIFNDRPIASAVFSRAFLEHYAVNKWVLDKSNLALSNYITKWDKKHLEIIEKKLAKCLVGTKTTSEAISIQKDYWDSVYGNQKVNLMEAIKNENYPHGP